MKLRFWLLFLAVFLLGALKAHGQESQGQKVVLAVLAKRGAEKAIEHWEPLAYYLSQITPYQVILKPFSFKDLREAVSRQEVDLVLVNPAMYVEFEACCGVSPVVTLKNLKFGREYVKFGGVIFTQASRPDIKEIKDLRSKTVPPLRVLRVGAVDPWSFGGWLAQWRLFKKLGLKRGLDYRVRFYGTHDAVVYAVLKGEVDVGCVRTGILETMAQEGKIELSYFRILNLQKYPGFDLLVSTPLYPEWPLARTPRLKAKVAERLASVLLAIPCKSWVARATQAAWTIPRNYQPVHECLKELGVGPYAKLKEQLLRQARKTYYWTVVFFVLLSLLGLSATLYIIRLHRNLSRAYRELSEYRDCLEEKVQERTKHLEEMTERLQKEVEERRRAERLAYEEKERLAVVLRSLADAVIVTDTEGRVTLINPAAERLLKVRAEEILGKTFCRLVSFEPEAETCPRLVEASVRGEVMELKEARLYLPSGEEILVEGTVAPVRSPEGEIVGSVVVLRDITLKKKFEGEILDTSRLETLRLLASGVAHDFNNLLASMVGYLNLIKMRAKDEELKELVEKAEKACFVARTLTRELLTYTTGGKPIKRLVNLARKIKEYTELALSGSKVRLELELGPDLWPVEVDPDQLSICLNNLLLNARQAMPEGGKVFLRVRNRRLPPQNPYDLPAGPYVEIEVEDTGPGIPAEILPRIFEPFFTTREGGSGLGLFSCRRIIEAHGGKIVAESKPGKGALFRILLPAKPEEKVPEESREDESKVSRKIRPARVLILDDEVGVRETMAEMLKLHGLQVETAETGEEALKIFTEALKRGEPFDLVILDLTVPGGLGGKELLPRLRELHPEVRAIVASGYSADPVMSYFERYGFNGVLVKPFSAKDMLEVVKQVLDEG